MFWLLPCLSIRYQQRGQQYFGRPDTYRNNHAHLENSLFTFLDIMNISIFKDHLNLQLAWKFSIAYFQTRLIRLAWAWHSSATACFNFYLCNNPVIKCNVKMCCVSLLPCLYNLWRQRHTRVWWWDTVIRPGTRIDNSHLLEYSQFSRRIVWTEYNHVR